MPKPPNIVFISSDQHSARWTGCYGERAVRTPFLDKLAGRGVLFERAYSLNPVCVPARAAMMTGMYSSDCDSFCNSTVWNGRHPTWGTQLREAGYSVYSTGKFDLNGAFDMGFEHLGDQPGAHWKNPDITSLFRCPGCYRMDVREMIDGTPRDERLEGSILEASLEQLRRATSQEKPWAVYVGFTRPHPAYTGLRKLFEEYLASDLPMPEVSQDQLDQLHPVYEQLRAFQRLATPVSQDRVRRARAAYFAMITELDEDIETIHQHLAETGELANTIFIYTSDHGECLGEHGQWMKSNLMDEAVRVPMIISGPGIPEGVRIKDAVSHVDLVATIRDLAGITEGPCRGTNLRPLMAGEGKAPAFAFTECHNGGNCTGSFMIQRGAWKYVEFAGFPEGFLFNLDDDPREKHNRWDDPDCAEIRKEMRTLLTGIDDPEALSERAFVAQERKLHDLIDGKSRDAIEGLLSGRLGAGQARVLANRLVRR